MRPFDISNHYALIQKERLEAFSDGIFAISVTLVAANLRAPEVDDAGFNLFNALAGMWQQYFSQVLSFMACARVAPADYSL